MNGEELTIQADDFFQNSEKEKMSVFTFQSRVMFRDQDCPVDINALVLSKMMHAC